MRTRFLLPAILLCALLPSCNNNTKQPVTGSGLAAYRAYNLPATRASNPSAVRVKVSLRNQATYVMEGNQPLLVMPVSIGKV